MPIKQESLQTELRNLLKSKGYSVTNLNSDGKTVPVPEEADVFQFDFVKDNVNYGTVSAAIDGLHQLVVYFNDKIANSPKTNKDNSESWEKLLRDLKNFSRQRQLSFDLSDQDNLASDMAKRTHMKKLDEGYHAMGKKASYNDGTPNVKMVIQHTRPIEEGEQRYRNIAKIFVENTNGERFLLPTNKPGLARVYARHIAEGGTPYDERGVHITSLCEEYSKMAGFVRATRNGQFNESAQKLVTEGINHYEKLRESLRKMASGRGYNSYFESYTPALMEDEGSLDLSEMFMSSSLDPRIESVMPILSKLSKSISENTNMKEIKALEEWADKLTEFASHDHNDDDGDDQDDNEERLQELYNKKFYLESVVIDSPDSVDPEELADWQAELDTVNDEIQELGGLIEGYSGFVPGRAESTLREFANNDGGNGGDEYLKTLASAWLNQDLSAIADQVKQDKNPKKKGMMDRVIDAQRAVEKILERGIVCGDGKVRKFFIDYNSDFDGVRIVYDDYAEYSDYDDDGNDIDSRTGKPWPHSKYDEMEFKDHELDESSVAEATGDKPFDNMMKNISKGAPKQATADRKEQKKQNQQQARDAFGSMFGGNPADKLKIKEQDVAEGIYSHDVERAFPNGKASGVKSHPAVVKTNKPIGTRVSDIGKGGKEHNVKTDKEWDKQKGVAEGSLEEDEYDKMLRDLLKARPDLTKKYAKDVQKSKDIESGKELTKLVKKNPGVLKTYSDAVKRDKKLGVAEGYQLDEGIMDSLNGIINKIKMTPGIQKFIGAAKAKQDQLIQALQHSANGKDLVANIQQAVGGQQAVAEGWGQKIGGAVAASAGGGLLAGAADIMMRAYIAMGKPDIATMWADKAWDASQLAPGTAGGQNVMLLVGWLVVLGALAMLAGVTQVKKGLEQDAQPMREGQEDLDAILRIIRK